MATWDNADFDREATAIARAFWAGREQNGAPLNELATKTARDNGLNPEQIRRLCRNANTKAFEQKHASLKGEADRTPNFELADPEAVIQQLHQTIEQASTKHAEAEYPDLSNEYAPAHNGALFAQEKIATLYREVDAALPPQRSPLVELRRAEKLAQEMTYERHALNFAWDEALSKVAAQTTYQGWNHAEFEKNAVALFGADVLPELNAVRHRCRLPAIAGDVEETEVSAKLASLQTLWVGVPDTYTALLADAMKIRAKFATLVEQQQEVSTKIQSLKKVVRHG